MDELSGCSIAQLVAAPPGWYARYCAGSQTTLTAIAVWALIESENGGRRVVGIAPDEGGALSCHAEEGSGFERYVYLAPASTQPGSPIPTAR